MLLVAGTIGAGKSSLTAMLAEELHSKPFYENVEDNEVLPLFYSDPKKYALLLQIFFLNKRFLAMKDALQHATNVLDRSIYEDSLLFHLNADLGRVTPVEVAEYDKLLDTMLKELEKVAPRKSPDLLIYIKVSFETMLSRIALRGRDYEQIAHDETLYQYYEELNKRYDIWYDHFDLCPKMTIDGDAFDFVEDAASATAVLAQIKAVTQQVTENVGEVKATYFSADALTKGIF